MSWSEQLPRLVVVVGGGGVGKTTLAAGLALRSADRGDRTLVMTFDPSLRLKDALGVGEAARDAEVTVDSGSRAELVASLLDARRTFDRLVERYAPSRRARDRIFENRFYHHLGGTLAGILEYMAVERLFEASEDRSYDRIVLDTPPTSQALDLLEAPTRIVTFLDSGALRFALRPWFDTSGHLRSPGPFARRVERYLDELVGLELLRQMTEFFDAFAPLFAGFRRRASEVERLLRSPQTLFLLVVGPGEDRIPDAMFFARRLKQSGYHLGPLVVNRLHPAPAAPPATTAVDATRGDQLIEWLGRRDRAGLQRLRALLGEEATLVGVPLLPREPTDLAGLRQLMELASAASAP